MTRKLLLFVCSVSVLFLTSCGSGGLSSIRKDRLVRIGTVPFEGPLLHQKGQELVGPEARLGNQIAERIRTFIEEEGGSSKIDLKWIDRSYSTLVAALKNGEVDLILGVFGITEDRKEQVAFSEPYYTSELVLIINPIHKDIRPNALDGKNIGVRQGTAVEQFVQQKFKGSKTVPFKTLDDVVLALRRRDIDAAVEDRYMAAFSLDTVPGVAHLEPVPGTLGTVDCAVAVTKGEQQLLDVINEVIAQVKAEDLYAQWLQEEAGDQLVRVENRQQKRLEAAKPRRVVIRVSKDRNYDFDIYRMANLRFILTDQDSGETYTSSRINFQSRVGISSTQVPPGTYKITLPKMNNWTPGGVTIVGSDPEQVTVNIRLRRGGSVVLSRS